MSLIINTANTVEPLTLSEVKSFLRISHSDEDSNLNLMIAAARAKAEEFTGRAFNTQTWDLWFDRWPNQNNGKWWEGTIEASIAILSTPMRWIALPRPPLLTVTHIKTYGETDLESTFSASNYIVDTKGTPGRVILKTGSLWPVDLRAGNAINIQFTCGYGASATSVPGPIRQAILMIAAQLFEKRGDCEGGDVLDIPALAKNLLQPYRVMTIGELNQVPKGFR